MLKKDKNKIENSKWIKHSSQQNKIENAKWVKLLAKKNKNKIENTKLIKHLAQKGLKNKKLYRKNTKKKKINKINEYYLTKYMQKKKKKPVLNKIPVQPLNLIITKYSKNNTNVFLHPSSIKYLFISRLFKKKIIKWLAFT